MINGRFKREKADPDSLGSEGKKMYNWFKDQCPTRADKCDPIPYDEAIESCGKLPLADAGVRLISFQTPNNNEICRPVSKKAFREYCIEAKNEIPSCYQFYPTTKTTTVTTTTVTTTTTTSSKTIPFIIGGLVGVIVLLAVVIGILCYCKKKKASGMGQSMTGTTIGGKKKTAKTTKTGTKTNTGTTKTGTTTGTTRY